ncbi:5' nucleotidase, NT5C type [Peptostreptococcus faecalis]|uniref:5' nucleotidase, NT5C type n=1 Tax=Peptostreptococcus faecalis TaxID=2045015 RepID=UPI001FA938FD|nr:haloacid dehalogenase-like hydrolase [Peptostreptococcus faecalis]
MSRNICIDIDGTMIDPYFFVPYLNKLTGKEITNDQFISTNWNDVYGTEYDWIYENFDINYSYIYEEMNILDNVTNVINQLERSGDKVFFVTARSSEIDDITKKWISNNGLDPDLVYSLSGNGGKVSMAKKLRCDIFIEDDPENAINLDKAGIKVILLDCAYNQNIDGQNIIRVKNWKEIQKILLK